MPDTETLSHTRWDGKYPMVFVPKYRRKALYTELRRHLEEVFRARAAQKECRIEEGHVMADHVHMLLSLPPKYSVPQVVGFLKGKSALHMARTFMGRRNNSTGHHFWARGMTFRPLGGIRRPFGSTSVRKRWKIVAWINWACGRRAACWRLLNWSL